MRQFASCIAFGSLLMLSACGGSSRGGGNTSSNDPAFKSVLEAAFVTGGEGLNKLYWYAPNSASSDPEVSASAVFSTQNAGSYLYSRQISIPASPSGVGQISTGTSDAVIAGSIPAPITTNPNWRLDNNGNVVDGSSGSIFTKTYANQNLIQTVSKSGVTFWVDAQTNFLRQDVSGQKVVDVLNTLPIWTNAVTGNTFSSTATFSSGAAYFKEYWQSNQDNVSLYSYPLTASSSSTLLPITSASGAAFTTISSVFPWTAVSNAQLSVKYNESDGSYQTIHSQSSWVANNPLPSNMFGGWATKIYEMFVLLNGQVYHAHLMKSGTPYIARPNGYITDDSKDVNYDLQFNDQFIKDLRAAVKTQ